jgi:hypothetical protein
LKTKLFECEKMFLLPVYVTHMCVSILRITFCETYLGLLSRYFWTVGLYIDLNIVRSQNALALGPIY